MKTLQPDTLIHNPQGCRVVSSVEIPAHAESVWALVGNFAGFDQFIPALSHIEMTGEGISCLRKKFFKDGNLVVEQLNSRDDQEHYMTWTIIAEPEQGGAEALPGFQAFVQGFADDAMNNVLKRFA